MFRKIVLLFLIASGFVSIGVQAQNFQISGGTFYSVVMCSNGTIYTWGDNSNYQLGRNDDLAFDPNPDQIPIETLPKIKSVDGGSGAHAVALACDGTVWTWGANGACQLGDGICQDGNGTACQEGTGNMPGNCDTPTPVQVVGGETGDAFLQDVIYVTASTSSTYAITSDNRLLAWGHNARGQLGNAGAGDKASSPVYVQNPSGTGPIENVIAIDATDYGCYAIVDDNNDGIGTVYGWGYNDNKQFGTGGNIEDLPVAIVTDEGNVLDNVTMITAGDTHGLFLDEDGYLWAVGGVWGGGNQLGTNIATYDPTAGEASKVLAGEQVDIPGFEDEPNLANVKQISAGQAHSMAIVEYDGVSYMMAWGTNNVDPWKGGTATGHLGNGSNVSSNIPQFVLNSDGTDKLTNVQSISDGDQTSYATTFDPVTLEKSTYIWGGNYFGQVGDGTTDNALYPTLFNEPECKPADPCPVAELGPEIMKVCPADLDIASGKFLRLFAGSLGENYEYEWEVTMYANGNPIVLPPAVIERFYPKDDKSGAYLNIGFEADVKVTITDNTPTSALTCNDCELAVDEMQIRYQTPTFETKLDSFCAGTARFKILNPQGTDYAVFLEYEGGTALESKSTTGDDIYFDVSVDDLTRLTHDAAGVAYHEDTIYYRTWIEDVTINKGYVAADMNASCKSGKLQNDQTLQNFKVFLNSAYIESVTVDVVDANLQTPKSLTPVIYKEKFTNNMYLPDTDVIFWEGDPVSVSASGELVVPLQVEVPGDVGRGRSYWLGFKHGGQAVDLANHDCGSGNFPQEDDYNGGFQVTAYSKGWNLDKEFGAAYNWELNMPSDYTCGRVPVDIKMACPPCKPATPSVQADKDELCPGDVAIVETKLTLDMSDAGQTHDVFWFNGVITEDDYSTIKESDAVFSDLAIAQGGAVADFEITYDMVKAGTGEYTVLTRDADKPASESCYKLDYITIVAKDAPTYAISGGAEYCEGAEIDLIDVELGGTAPFEVVYSINGTDQAAVEYASATGELEMPVQDPDTYIFEIEGVTDATGCVAVIDSDIPGETIIIGANPTAVFTEPSVRFCTGDATPIDLTAYVGPATADADGETEAFYGAHDAVGTEITTDFDISDPDMAAQAYEFSYVYTNSKNCSDTVNFAIDVNGKPTVDITVLDENGDLLTATGGVYNVCELDEITIDGGAEGVPSTVAIDEHLWESADTDPLSSVSVASPSFQAAAGANSSYDFTYTATDENGCFQTGEVTIAVNAPAVITVADFPEYCVNENAIDLGDFITTDVTVTADYSTGADITTDTFDPTAYADITTPTAYEGTFIATTEFGCESSEDFSITANPIPVVTLDAVEAVCIDGDAVNLVFTPTGGDWGTSAGVTADEFIPADAGVGVHELTYTATEYGCTAFDTHTIEVYALPEVSIDAIADVCAVEGEVVDVASALTPAINTNTLTQLTSTVVTVAGTEVPIENGVGSVDFVIDLTYDYEDDNGCFASATGTLTTHSTPAVGYVSATGINVDPQASLEGADNVDDLVIADGEAGATFEWEYEDGTSIGGATATLNIEDLGSPYIHEGAHVGYVTQVLNDCKSEKTKVEWFIIACTAPLAVEKANEEYCEETTVPTLTAESTDPTGYPTVEIFTDASDENSQVSTAGEYTPTDGSLSIGENVFYARVYDATADCWGAPVPMIIVKNENPTLSIDNVESGYCSSSTANIVFNANGSVIDTETLTGIDSKDFDPSTYTTTTDITIDWEVTDDKGCVSSTSATTTVTHVEPPVVGDAVWQLKDGETPNTEMIITAVGTVNYYFDGNDEGVATAPFVPSPATDYFDRDSDLNYIKQVKEFGFTQTVDGCTSEMSTAEYIITPCKLGKAVVTEIDPICEGEALPSITADYGVEGTDYYDASQTVFQWKHGAVDVNEGPELDPSYLAGLDPSTTAYQFTVFQYGPSIDAPHDDCLSPPATVKFTHNPLPAPEFDNLVTEVCKDGNDVTLNLVSTNDVAKQTQSFTVSAGTVGLDKYLELASLTDQTQTVEITGTMVGENGCEATVDGAVTVHFVEAPELVDPAPNVVVTQLPVSLEVDNLTSFPGSVYEWYTDATTNDVENAALKNTDKSTLTISDTDHYGVLGDIPHEFYVKRMVDNGVECWSEATKGEIRIHNCPARMPLVESSNENCVLDESMNSPVVIDPQDYVTGFTRDQYSYVLYDQNGTFIRELTDESVDVTDFDVTGTEYVYFQLTEKAISYGGCESNPYQFSVKFNQPETPTITAPTQPFCEGADETVNLIATNADVQVDWTNPGGVAVSDQAVNIVNSDEFGVGTHDFTAINYDQYGCPSEVGSASFEVRSTPAVPDFDQYNFPYCQTFIYDEVEVTTFQIGADVEWSKDENFPFGTATGDSFDPGSLIESSLDYNIEHTVFVRENNGCPSDARPITITIYGQPGVPSLEATDGVKVNTAGRLAEPFCEADVFGFLSEGVILSLEKNSAADATFNEYTTKWTVSDPLGLSTTELEGPIVNAGISESGKYVYSAYFVKEIDGLSCPGPEADGEFEVITSPSVIIGLEDNSDKYICNSYDPLTGEYTTDYQGVLFDITVEYNGEVTTAYEFEQPYVISGPEENSANNTNDNTSISFDPLVSGINEVELTVSMLEGGCTATAVKQLHVAPRPSPSYSVSISGDVDEETGEVQVTFSNDRTDDLFILEEPNDLFPQEFEWQFGRESDMGLYVANADVADFFDTTEVKQLYEYGEYEVILRAYLDKSKFQGCYTELKQTIFVDVPTNLSFPNAMSRSHQAELIKLYKVFGSNVETFEMTIYDAWNNIVWYTNAVSGGAPAEMWDGKGKDGQELREGVYTWKASATFRNGKTWEGIDNGSGTKRPFGFIHILD